MAVPSEASIRKNFNLFVNAAIAGARCPQNYPHGPVIGACTKILVERGAIRVEVYSHNYRRVVIHDGEHKGKATASHPCGLKPYLINGVHINRIPHRTGKVAP